MNYKKINYGNIIYEEPANYQSKIFYRDLETIKPLPIWTN